MNIKKSLFYMLPIYIAVLAVMIGTVYSGSSLTSAALQKYPACQRTCVIIDPGHGGEDGGATSCTGILESKYNLDISLRLNDLMHLLGMKTYMTRTEDRSIYKTGNTIGEKKISDIHERVRIVDHTVPAILISIHQNFFPEPQYKGAQILYASSSESREIAQMLQKQLIISLNSNPNRTEKRGRGVYLLDHIKNPGVLIECGFLSNPEEEAMLRNETYQKQLCSVIACQMSIYLNSRLSA